jgi:hypothetical protein
MACTIIVLYAPDLHVVHLDVCVWVVRGICIVVVNDVWSHMSPEQHLLALLGSVTAKLAAALDIMILYINIHAAY